MKKCAFLTMDRLDDFEHYDYMVYEPLNELGWEVEEVSWRDRSADWNRYEAVVIRTPWDYQDEPEAFMQVLEAIESSSARLENALSLVRWNIDKIYLRDLEERGVPIVPTLWGDPEKEISREAIASWFSHFDNGRIVIKPRISANADDTFLLDREEALQRRDELGKLFARRNYMVQPAMNRIMSEGEFSLIYFGQEYSHTLLKTPEKQDFRVQEEHGGSLKRVDPEPLMKEVADQILSVLTPVPLYSRVDLVREGEQFYLMELELIEPSLYFNMDPDSPARFARFFDRWMNR